MDKCIICDKNRSKYSKKFCRLCYERDYFKRNPEKHELKKKNSRNRQRMKKGLPLCDELLRTGEGFLDGLGYKIIYKPNHPNARERGRILEHIFVMSEYLGRPLMKHENIHHKNGIRHDNRIENLELWCKGQPAGQRVQDRILFYKEFLEKYDFEVKSKTVTNIFHND